MVNAEFMDLTARMRDAERDVASRRRDLAVAESILRDIENKRSVIFKQMLDAVTVKQPEPPSRRAIT